MLMPSMVAVCACTFRRPQGLAALLQGVARQQFEMVPKPDLHVVIADNEGSAEARHICESFQAETGIPLTYVQEPERGISYARNACLDSIPEACDFFAFIDDDEVPEPDWLERLIEAQAATNADVVQGPVIPLYEPGAPRWLVDGEFLGFPRRNWRGTKLQLQDLQELNEAYTNNVLVRRASVVAAGTRFDPAFALTGGGDTLFFRTLKAAGARIVFAARARVTETVPAKRATLWYRLELEYRIGNNRLPSRDTEGKKRKLHRRIRQLWRDSGLQKISQGAGQAVASAATGRLTTDFAVVCALRCAYGLGQCVKAFGISYRPYR
jgi:glycosyltransferase involved in cell wall biosynthesis